MAQRIITVLEDDIDGGEAAETVTFALDGATYEIDLNGENAAKLRSAFSSYVEQARRVSGSAGRAKRKSTSGPSASEIREWASAQGLDVPARGRIPASVREAYDAAR